MPIPLLNAYADHMPRLSAEESLLAAERVAVGSGSLRKGVGRRIADGWRRRAQTQRMILRPTSRAQWEAQAAGVGVGVKRVPKVSDG
jgi:hypothetical protein